VTRARNPIDPAALAAQHLLRHIGDPVALGRNPLVSSLFGQGDGARLSVDATNRVEALILECAERLRADSSPESGRERRERQYQILVRCDLRGESHTAVASALALSRRQFYRERREASGYLARFLTDYVRRQTLRPRGVTVDPFALEFSRAKALRLAGEPARAESVLRALTHSDAGIERKIDPWCALIDLLISDNRIEEAETEMQHAEALLQAANGVPRALVDEQQARLDMERAWYLWFQGLTRETLAIDERSEGVITRMSRSTQADAHEFYVTTRLRQIQCGLMSGTVERAAVEIEHLRAYMAAADDVPLPVQISYLIHSGSVRDHISGGSDEAFARLNTALVLAQRHGLTELVIETMSQLSSNAQLRGDSGTAMRYVNEAIPLAARYSLPAQRGMVLNVAAMNEAVLGHHQAAVELATQAREVLAPNSLERIYSSLAEAQARLSTREFEPAAAAASDAHAAAGRISSDRLAGTALRLLAESFEGMGHRTEAAEYILGAVACLEREGPPYALFQAYRAGVAITGDRRLRSRAKELAAILKL
jgi:tetratricopeptide (TPR) repeat protein